MIQDIFPSRFDNSYKIALPQPKDIVFCFRGSAVLAKISGELVTYPQYCEFILGITSEEPMDVGDKFRFTYLFSIDETRYFLADMKDELQKGAFIGEMADGDIHEEMGEVIPGYMFIGINSFRKAKPQKDAFAAVTAYHLYGWYRDNRFCGRCMKRMVHDDRERMMKCPHCGNTVYPKISPAVIIAVVDKDRILLTKYAGRAYKNYALIAGFAEIGETLEETVRREVFEEVGLHVKNIRYYKSQPWGLSSSLLAGFFCELDGDDRIHLQEDELSVGIWVRASELDIEDEHISLTREMIAKFKRDNT